MITLYGYGRAFGLPDASPFVVKAELLLKLAGLDYAYERGDPRKGPKRKLPYIVDGGLVVPDSTLIRLHIEKTRGFDYDKGLSDEQKGAAWSIEKMLEDHFYWHVVHERWMPDANFDKGPRHYFDDVPMPLRSLVVAIIRRQVRNNLRAHGMGRYSQSELAALGQRAAEALSRWLGDKPWLMGSDPCGADATGYAFVSSALCPHFDGPLRDSVAGYPNLVAYADRGTARWFSDLAKAS